MGNDRLNMPTTCINDLDLETYLRKVYHRKRGLAVTRLGVVYLVQNEQIYMPLFLL